MNLLPKELINKINDARRREFYEQRVLPFKAISEFAMKVRISPRECMTANLDHVMTYERRGTGKNTFAIYAEAIKSGYSKFIYRLQDIYDRSVYTVGLLTMSFAYDRAWRASLERNHNRTWKDIMYCHFFDAEISHWVIKDDLYDPIRKTPVIEYICGYDPRNKCQLNIWDSRKI